MILRNYFRVLTVTVSSNQTREGHRQTTTWALLTGRVPEVLEDQTRAPGLTGGTISRVGEDRRTLREDRTSTGVARRAGGQDLVQDTRAEEEEATGGEDTEEVEGTQGTGAPMRGSGEESLEDGETTGESLFILNVWVPAESGTLIHTGLDLSGLLKSV